MPRLVGRRYGRPYFFTCYEQFRRKPQFDQPCALQRFLRPSGVRTKFLQNCTVLHHTEIEFQLDSLSCPYGRGLCELERCSLSLSFPFGGAKPRLVSPFKRCPFMGHFLPPCKRKNVPRENYSTGSQNLPFPSPHRLAPWPLFLKEYRGREGPEKRLFAPLAPISPRGQLGASRGQLCHVQLAGMVVGNHPITFAVPLHDAGVDQDRR